MRRLFTGTKLYTEDMNQCEALEIPNPKSRIPNNFQIQNSNDQNRFWDFEHCDLFGIWCLEIGICSASRWW
jgi:hypothetical protein